MKFLLDHDVPDDLSYLLRELGHEVTLLRQVLRCTASDAEVLENSFKNDCLLITCNRDDFLNLSQKARHHGIIILVRRKTRTAERAALLRLLERAGPSGLADNVNFA